MICRLAGKHAGPLRHLWHDQRLQLLVCIPWGWVGLVLRWWMHAGAIEGLHGKRWIAGEAIVVLDGRLVMGVVCSIWAPASMLVLKGLLVEMVLVIHVQLAHVGEQR